MPGIFAELERTRHVYVVEATIDELETKIFELDMQSSNMQQELPDTEAEKRHQEKRSMWLDTTYLRNVLVSWNTQLAKIGQYTEELADTIFKAAKTEEEITYERTAVVDKRGISHGGLVREIDGGKESQRAQQQQYGTSMIQPDPEATKDLMRRVGHKIKDRIQAIIDEYDDKIRDCTMRIDGMAMATQWVWPPGILYFAGETNLIRPKAKQTSRLLWRRVETPGT
jgi:hypothetical protein